MRVKPTALSSIAAIAGYVVVVFTTWAAVGMDYDEVGDTLENLQRVWSWPLDWAPSTWSS
jgi:hypothetical protein